MTLRPSLLKDGSFREIRFPRSLGNDRSGKVETTIQNGGRTE